MERKNGSFLTVELLYIHFIYWFKIKEVMFTGLIVTLDSVFFSELLYIYYTKDLPSQQQPWICFRRLSELSLCNLTKVCVIIDMTWYCSL